MSKSDELLNEGVVTQDPEREERVVFNVPIYIPKIAVDNGGFEAFASAYDQTPTILEKEVEVANPESAQEKAVKVVWGFVGEVFRGQMLKQAEATAREQAKAQLDAMLGQGLHVGYL